MTDELKERIFKRLLELEHLSEVPTYDDHNYNEMSNGAFSIIRLLGLATEYIEWSHGK